MRPVAKLALLSVAIASAGIGGYFLLRKSMATLQQEVIAQLPPAEAATLQPVIIRMNRQELKDMATFLRQYNSGVKQLSDEALKARIAAISSKYNIFT